MNDPAERPGEGEESFAELIARLRPGLLRTVARFRIPAAEADDFIQDALLALLRNGARVQSPEAWLRGTLRNLCLLYYREQARWRLEPLDAAVLERVALTRRPAQEDAEILRDLASLIACLPRTFRLLLLLRDLLGWTDREVAARLGYQPDSVPKLRSRALERMRRAAR